MADDFEFPDELDLGLRQKWFVIRALIEHYHRGMNDISEILAERADGVVRGASEDDAVQWAYASGYVAASRSITDSIDAVDWEEAIITAQANAMQDHHPEDDPEE